MTEEENDEQNVVKENNEADDDSEFIIDFTTGSAINRVGLKFLVVYLPIF